MPRPVIGITVDRDDERESYASPFTYAQAIECAGGLPLLLPYKVSTDLVGEYLDLIDGLLFSGGSDLNPAVYGEDWHSGTSPIDPDRQSFESALIAEVERRRMPVLGVCLGSQVMNVHRGGSLHQFLPDLSRDNPLEHRKVGPDLIRHSVKVDVSSQLGSAIGKPEVSVNTYHKQAVNRLGKGLKVIATAPDGVIEGFEDPSFPLFAAVQWHPERLTDEVEHLGPFKLLVDHARKSK
jgi:putative glutamine amidotransferase